jgi:hypothetical protein
MNPCLYIYIYIYLARAADEELGVLEQAVQELKVASCAGHQRQQGRLEPLVHLLDEQGNGRDIAFDGLSSNTNPADLVPVYGALGASRSS